MKLLKVVALLALCLTALFYHPASAQTGVGKTYYVSAQGNDSNNGTSAATPFASLAKVNAVLVPGDTVRFRRGDVFSGTFHPVASGTANAPISVGAYGTGAKPMLTGFSRVTNWKPLDNGLYESVLDSFPPGRLEMVRFNKRLQPKGRLPKAGNGEASWFHIQSHTTNKQITTADAVPNVTGGEIVQKKYQWIIDRGHIDNMSSATLDGQEIKTINFTEYPTSHPPYNAFDKNGFFVQNHVRCLTEPGDWSYDEATRKITLFFGDNSPANHRVEVAVVETLVDLTHKSHIQFDDISFIGSNGDMVKLDTSPFITFNNCEFSFAGGNGISVQVRDFSSHSASPHGTIKNCKISQVNNNGINLEENPNWTIAQSTLSGIGLHPGMGRNGDGQYIGLFAPGDNSLIQQNDISNIGYIAVYFVGSGTQIRNNYIHHFCLTKSDGGGIYTYGGNLPRKNHAKPRIIDGNIVHDGVGNIEGVHQQNPGNPYAPQAHGIYMDGNTTDVIITNNTSFKNATSGLWLGSNANVTAHGNTLADNHTQQLAIDDLKASEDPPNTPYPGSHPINLDIQNNLCFAFQPEQLCLKMNLNHKPAALTILQYVAGIGTLSNNLYLRPVREPDGVSTRGYPQVPTFNDYPNGGVVETSWDNLFLSLDVWQKKYGQDAGTKKTFRTVADAGELRLEYNPTNVPVVKKLPGVFDDATGKIFTNSITLQPYSSAVLMLKQE